MRNDHLTLDSDLPAALRRLARPPALSDVPVPLPPSRTRRALVAAAQSWRRRHDAAGAAVGEHLHQLERVAAALLEVDVMTARRLDAAR